MKRPTNIKDDKVLEYIEYLEKKIQALSSNSVIVDSYKALTKFISEGNKVLREASFNAKQFNDKDDKIVERAQKFADKLPEYIKSIQDIEKTLEPEALDKAKKEAAGLYEKAMRGDS